MKILIRMLKLDFPAEMADKELELHINVAYSLAWICLPFIGVSWYVIDRGIATHWSGMIPLTVMVLGIAGATLVGMLVSGYRAVAHWIGTRRAVPVPV